MSKKYTLCLLIFAINVILSSGCIAADLGIITGGEKGTYYQFGLNLKELLAKDGISLNVYPSNGSIENVNAVYKRAGTQMGIVQSDVLAFIGRLQSDEELKLIARKIKMVFPLYNEEIHLLGRSEILDFEELEDKRVAVGEEGSGTYLTAKLLFELTEINPREMLTIGREEALSQLKSGKIDAMFYVAGYPVKLFADDVSEKDGLALIPITHKNILEFYPQGEIPPNTYKWQRQAVKTAAVKAVLVSFDFKSTNCEAVGKFAKLVTQNIDWLTKHGHPKWKNVDFNYSLKGWEQYSCVRKYLGKPAVDTIKRSSEENPVWRVVKDTL
jgi:uncharacterized protein